MILCCIGIIGAVPIKDSGGEGNLLDPVSHMVEY